MVRGQKLVSGNSDLSVLLLLWALKKDWQRRMLPVISLEHCVLGEWEPCGLVIQMACLTQAEGCQISRGNLCEQERSARTALGLMWDRASILQYRQGFGFVTF